MTVRRMAILVWIAVIAASAWYVTRLHVDTDMTAFLPRAATPAQRVLVDQFRDGVVSRMVLIAIEGDPVDALAAISRTLADRLRGNTDFVTVQNGEDSGFGRDRDVLWSNRYLLSDQVSPERFSTEGLRGALEQDLADLGSDAGFLLKRTLAADPTGEMLHLIEQQQAQASGPARHDGVWVSPDASKALMLVRLRAAGSDIDGAQRALTAIRSAFDALTSGAANRSVRLVMTGPPVFAVEARDRIKSDATRLSIVASLLVASGLLAVYRSLRVLALAFVPVVSGAVVGVAAVGLVFRTIHGITLGFGATLIGEAVDYAVYLFTQTSFLCQQDGPDSPVERTLRRIWPTLRLGVLTSICGFSAMLLSSFEGFAQLGLFTITGLAVAVCVTRFVLPALLPARFAGVRQSATMMRLARTVMRLRNLRWGVLVVAVASVAVLAVGKGDFWASSLASLSPVSLADQRLDQSLRQDMRAPDATWLIVIQRPDADAVLQAAERLTSALDRLVAQGALAGFDTPTRSLPSEATQRARRAALPDPAVLQSRLDTALQGMPFQPACSHPS